MWQTENSNCMSPWYRVYGVLVHCKLLIKLLFYFHLLHSLLFPLLPASYRLPPSLPTSLPPSLPPSAVDPPEITDQPDPQLLIVPGQPATFTVTATGDNLMYQWQKDGVDIATGDNSATYTIAAVAESDEGAYRCVVTNAANSVTSTAASLTVCK